MNEVSRARREKAEGAVVRLKIHILSTTVGLASLLLTLASVRSVLFLAPFHGPFTPVSSPRRDHEWRAKPGVSGDRRERGDRNRMTVDDGG